MCSIATPILPVPITPAALPYIVKAGQTFQREVSVTGTLIRAVNTAVQRHHHTDGVFSNGLLIIGWNTDYFEPQFFAASRSTLLKPAQRRAIYLTPCFFSSSSTGRLPSSFTKNTYRFAAIGSFSGFPSAESQKIPAQSQRTRSPVAGNFVVLFCAINGEFHKTFSSDVESHLSY